MQERRYKAWACGTSMALVGLATVAPACGGDDLSCGSGTRQDGDKCVAVQASAGGTAGDPDGGSGGPTANAPPSFDGVTSVSPASDVSLQVTWSAASDDTTPAEDITYNVYVRTASGEHNYAAPSAKSLPGRTSVLVPHLTPGDEYFVVVRAVDGAQASDENTTELSGRPENDAVPPTFTGAKATRTVGATTVEVSWDPGSDDKTAPQGLSYTVLWGATPEAALASRIGVVTEPGATKALVTELSDAETEFHFVVRARDAAGNTDINEASVAGTTGPDDNPPVFRGCTGVSQPGATTAVVTWLPADDDTTPAEEINYNVYAFTSPVDEETPFGGIQNTFVGGTSGEVTKLSPNTRYYFVCRAQDKHANEDTNVYFHTLLTLSDSSPPSFGGLQTVTPDATTAELVWSAATDDKTAASRIVYLVYQATTPGGQNFDAPAAKESNPGTTAVTLTGLQSNTEYYWVVRARDEAANIDPNTIQISARTLISFGKDVQPILTDHCVKFGCHSAENPPQGLNMEEGSAWFQLVNVPAVHNPSFMRIKPGFPDESYLYMKDTGAPGIAGGQMPPAGNTPPTAAMLETMRLWILQGAKRN